ncbi:MAG: dephospho-CoA kinase [Planctomycetes bacterium]|nr:dephospho-CoA kinase [Planctomycetota bacterium]
MALKPVIIGLTGGIGSGKTYVAGIFRGQGGKVIDADRIAHQVIDCPAVRRTLIKWYGRDILDKNGRIIRRKVAEVVFVGPGKIRRLNRLTHPYIRKEMLNRIKRAGSSVIVIDAPLLLESHLDKLCDYVVFIRTPEKLRLKRIMASRDWDLTESRRRARHQMPLSKKKSMADFTINNSTSATALAQVKRIFKMISKQKQ